MPTLESCGAVNEPAVLRVQLDARCAWVVSTSWTVSSSSGTASQTSTIFVNQTNFDLPNSTPGQMESSFVDYVDFQENTWEIVFASEAGNYSVTEVSLLGLYNFSEADWFAAEEDWLTDGDVEHDLGSIKGTDATFPGIRIGHCKNNRSSRNFTRGNKLFGARNAITMPGSYCPGA